MKRSQLPEHGGASGSKSGNYKKRKKNCMVDSKLQNPDGPVGNDDLVKCSICHGTIDKPKALPCLHTFCLKCLSSWVQTLAKEDPEKYESKVSCPNCRDDFPLPKGGVKDLETNFFVSKLKEWNELQKKLHEKDAKIPCTSCDGPGNEAVSRCVECNDFLCKKCVDSHKTLRVLKHHHVLTLDALRTGKLTMHNLPEQEMCAKHTGEVLRFYCVTCDEPMCRDCTVLHHPRPGHQHTDLESAAEERNGKLQELLTRVELIPKAIDGATAEDDSTLHELEANVKKAIGIYKNTAKRAVSEFSGRMKTLKAKRRKEIEAHRDSLKFQKARLCTALEMTQQIIQNGSEHDVATMYSSLSSSMEQLSKLNPKAVRKTMEKVEFTPNENLGSGLNSLGSLKTYEQWTLEKTIAPGQFNHERYIVLDTNNELAVATFTSGHYVKVFDENGTTKRQIQTLTSNAFGRRYEPNGTSHPWGLAVAQNGDIYVTDQNPHVKIYNAQGNFKNAFSAQNPGNRQWSYNDSSYFNGLAIDSNDRVYVGNYQQRYISIHNQDGTRITAFGVNLSPYFITVTPEDHVIVSNHDANSGAVHIYDTNGTQLHTFAAPPGGNFYPTGLCVVRDEVFVANYQGVPAVYRYSLKGEYIGILTNEVTAPWGLAVKENGEELFVCDNTCIKVFHP